MADDLARRVRDYARDRANKPLFTDGGMCVSSAWLAREFQVDSRTIAAALRPFGVRPGPVEPGTRGYVVAELAAIRFDDEPDAVTAWAADALAAAFATAIVVDPADLPEEIDGWRCGRCKTPMVGTGRCLACWPNQPDAVSRLSAGAGHDMTPALKAAGLL